VVDEYGQVQCVALTKAKVRCERNAAEGVEWCFMHDPNGAYRKKHPGLKVRRSRDKDIVRGEVGGPRLHVAWEDLMPMWKVPRR
jgi:hypothetical protein